MCEAGEAEMFQEQRSSLLTKRLYACSTLKEDAAGTLLLIPLHTFM